MKILITGAGGQLGKDCAKVSGQGNSLFAFTSKNLDISNKEQVRSSFRKIIPDVVINCAAYTAVDGCETDKENCWRVNAQGPGIISSACSDINARMIHISTDYVFDGRKPVPQPYTETDQVQPLSEYGASKLAGEEQIRKQLEDHLILRTAWLYGIDGNNFLKTMLRLAVNNPQRTIKVVNDQYGALTWTHRLALQINALLASELKGTFHSTAEGYCTWYEGARRFLEAMNVPFSMEPCSSAEYPTPAKRPGNSILENTELKKHGLNRMVPWEEDVLQFTEQNRSELLAGAGD